VTWRPYTIARYGVYAAVTMAIVSAWLGTRAGASLDFALMRSVFVFVVVTALGFGAELLLSFSGIGVPATPRTTEPPGVQTDE
jgi:hypothetical protein